jgi:hypothetical protein
MHVESVELNATFIPSSRHTPLREQYHAPNAQQKEFDVRQPRCRTSEHRIEREGGSYKRKKWPGVLMVRRILRRLVVRRSEGRSTINKIEKGYVISRHKIHSSYPVISIKPSTLHLFSSQINLPPDRHQAAAPDSIPHQSEPPALVNPPLLSTHSF